MTGSRMKSHDILLLVVIWQSRGIYRCFHFNNILFVPCSSLWMKGKQRFDRQRFFTVKMKKGFSLVLLYPCQNIFVLTFRALRRPPYMKYSSVSTQESITGFILSISLKFSYLFFFSFLLPPRKLIGSAISIIFVSVCFPAEGTLEMRHTQMLKSGHLMVWQSVV